MALPSIPTWLRLSAFHLAFLGAVAGYVAAFFPDQHHFAVAFALAGLAGEAVSAWRRVFLAETLLLATAAAAWAYWRPDGRTEWHAFLGMLMAAWLLVPSRLGWLRWLVPLAALEVLYLGINSESPARVRAACAVLLPIAIAALAVDAWMLAVSGARASARSRPPRLAMLTWALVPAAAAVAVGLGAGSVWTRPHKPLLPGERPDLGGPATTGLQNPSIGKSGTVSKDPTVAARLNWVGAAAPPPGMVYLRAMAYDRVVVEGSGVEWVVSAVETLAPVARGRAGANGAWLYRATSGNDVVLRPDGGGGIELDGLSGDREGNLYRAGFGESPRTYRVALDGDPREVRAGEPGDYSWMTERLTLLPWERIEAGQPWMRMSPEEAAESIATVLRSRCTYSLDLPEPATGSAGVLRTFLFDPDPARRVGHCQYFATAHAILMRRAHHRARLVIGFASSERDGMGVTFRGRDAHAWVEFVGRDGRWHRIDPTSAQQLERVKEWEPGEEPPPLSTSEIEGIGAEDDPRSERTVDWARRAWIAGGAAAAAILLWWLRRRWRRPRRDPRILALERRADDLFAFAGSLGVPIGPSATLASVADRLSERTGMDLRRWRDAHLAARFGTGTTPEPWPYAQMREAAKLRAGQHRAARPSAERETAR